jgi:acetamidase/formamidase
MKPTALLPTLMLLALTTNAQQPSTYQLKPTPKTIAWGYYDASTPPVLRIKSGDTVEVQTLITSTPTRLEGAGVKPGDVEQSLRDIVKEVTNKGPGGHILTGPIFIEGAEPGDVLEVRIKSIKLAIPYAYNAFSPGRGFLPEDFPYAKMRIIPLDEKRMVAHFAEGIEVPLHPFFGSIGVAPPDVSGRISSAPPWIHAGNLDNKELVAGTTLFIPIHARGALFLAGDGHAGQGNGEVDITAMETSLIGTFQLIVRKDMKLRWPRAETATHYITMGIHEDLTEATKAALREMIDFLVTEKHLVDGNKGVHAMIPKSIFVRSQEKPADQTDIITLERGPCFGTCPIYKVTVASDGTVTFEGFNFVKTKGRATARIKPEDFKKLVAEFEKIKYFSLDDAYVPGSPTCGPAATDMPYNRSAIQLKGKTKTINHYQGCFGSEVVKALFALDKKIDEVAGTEKWIK